MEFIVAEKIQSFHWQETALRYPIEFVTMLSSWELQSIYFLYQNQTVPKFRMQHPHRLANELERKSKQITNTKL